jgi:signal transduction histidine kinase
VGDDGGDDGDGGDDLNSLKRIARGVFGDNTFGVSLVVDWDAWMVRCAAMGGCGARGGEFKLALDGMSLMYSDQAVGAPAILWQVVDRYRHVLRGDDVRFVPVGYGGQLVGGILISARRLDFEGACAARFHREAAAWGRSRAQRLRGVAMERAWSRSVEGRDFLIDGSASVSVLGEVAAGVAHEINTPLGVIAGRAEFLARDETDAGRRETLGMIRKQAHQCSDVASALLEYAKPASGSPRRIALADWIPRLLTGFGTEVVEAAEIAMSPDAVYAIADVEQLGRAMGAVIENAVIAVRGGVGATGSEEAGVLKKGCLKINSDLFGTDGTVVVSVEDRGSGMCEEVVRRALIPFYSHRSAHRGRGLGLSVAERLIRLNGGRLWLWSRVGVGTKVFIALPGR